MGQFVPRNGKKSINFAADFEIEVLVSRGNP